MKKISVLVMLILSVLASSCTNGEDFPVPLSLGEYISSNADLPVIGDGIIACAAGGEAFENLFPESPVAVFFYPEEGATDFRYFETDGLVDDLNDFNLYVERSFSGEAVFNGYLWKFNRPPTDHEAWGRVSYRLNGAIVTCDPIRIKSSVKETKISDLVFVDQNEVLKPFFNWIDNEPGVNAIYFQVVADDQNNLLSGTYTYEPNFTFYDTSNVVLNITDPDTIPLLQPNADYQFVLMGVSEDNWVNLFMQKDFDTY